MIILDPSAKVQFTTNVFNKDEIPKIYACGTMWHESKEEMMEFLKSIVRLDEDQCARRIVREELEFYKPYYYELESKYNLLNSELAGEL